MSLAALRGEVERLTMALLEASARRTSLARRIGAMKKLRGLELRDAIREARLLERAANRAHALGLRPSFVKGLMGLLFDEALEAQGERRCALPLSRAELFVAHELAPLLEIEADGRWSPQGIERRVATALREEFGLDAGPERIVLVRSRPLALFLALVAALEWGDVVHVLQPAPRLYNLLSSLAGGRCVGVPSSAAHAWAPELGLLARQISPATRVILIGSPQVPPGRLYREAELRSLVRIAAKRDALLLSDESLAGLGGRRFRSALLYGDNVLACAALRLRELGEALPYLVAPRSLARKIRMLRDLLAPPSMGGRGRTRRAAGATRAPGAGLGQLAEELARLGFRLHRPQVGSMALVELPGNARLPRLLSRRRFMMMPGTFFGPYAGFVALYDGGAQGA